MVFIMCIFFAQTVSQTISLFVYAIGKDRTAARISVAGMTMKKGEQLLILVICFGMHLTLFPFITPLWQRRGGYDDGPDGGRYSGGQGGGGGYDGWATAAMDGAGVR